MIIIVSSEPGYFEQVIRPMLAPGQEGELIIWLKNIGLIPQNQRCRNALKNNSCNIPMSWIPASSPDVYQWQCLGCMEKRKIRDDSIFHNVKCKFKDAMRLLLGWSKGNSHEMMADILSKLLLVCSKKLTAATKFGVTHQKHILAGALRITQCYI